MKQTLSWVPLILLLLAACQPKVEAPPVPEEVPDRYSVQGQVRGPSGERLAGIRIQYEDGYVLSDEQGEWTITNLSGEQILTPIDSGYRFTPESLVVQETAGYLVFYAAYNFSAREQRIINWLTERQLPNGLVESTEDGDFVSLYDNALVAMTFLLAGEIGRAEQVFDFFADRISSELQAGVGGFSQFRDRNGVPTNHRWMGDNAWLLIALNNYQEMTGRDDYVPLATAITDWLIALQDEDGGLFAGYDASGALLDYKVTEGNIDAFNAIQGYTDFHADLLQFLANTRWDPLDQNLMAWPANPSYRWALDNHSWSYCIFPNYPISALHSAERFLTTQVSTRTGLSLEGYDIDEDQDAVFMEGSGQMALAWKLAGDSALGDYYLQELDKGWVESLTIPDAGGFPYASNRGTAYGSDLYWEGADIHPAISPGVWYLFARRGFNPFELGRDKVIPEADQFWLP